MRSLYCGCALCEVGPDGTLVLSGSAAEVIGPNDPGDLLLSIHESEKCLVGYRRRHLRRLHLRSERRRIADEAAGRDGRAHARRMRRTFGIVARAGGADRTLRIPGAMRHLGGIGRQALVVGAGERFEIWNPELAAASEDSGFGEYARWHVARDKRRGGRP